MTGPDRHAPRTELRLRLVYGPGAMLGPGKADLLAAIDETGSIAAAGRRMGMSYKRAWMLVETLNAMFSAPVVESTRGGASGGGARLTCTGQEVLVRFREIEKCAFAAAEPQIAALRDLLADVSEKT